MSNTYHFIGIKGAGMSALALMLHQMGHTVQGSEVLLYATWLGTSRNSNLSI